MLSTNSVSTPLTFDLSMLKGTRILVVDDNKTNLKIIETQLGLWDLKAITALNGIEALAQLVATADIKLVITDMEMPEMDGVTLASKIKEKYADLPVVMLSSIGDETRNKFPGLFSSILIKPVKQHHLCRAIQKALDKQEAAPAAEPGKQVLSPGFAAENPLSILVADDNQINLKLIDRALGKLGYKPDMVENGRDAVDKLAQTHYDVILMDIQMPVMDGLEATAHIRNGAGQQPYIIAMTANAMAEDKEICLNAGMDDYLSKPMKLEELVDALEKAAKG